MLFRGGGVEAVADGVGPQRTGTSIVEDFGDLREGFTLGQHLADLLVTLLFGGICVDIQAFRFGDFAGNSGFLDLVEFSQLLDGVVLEQFHELLQGWQAFFWHNRSLLPKDDKVQALGEIIP